MGILTWLKNFNKTPLRIDQVFLVSQLSLNREECLKIIPNEMKSEFLSLYSKRNVENLVRTAFDTRMINDKHRGDFFRMLVLGTLSIKGFGFRIQAFFGIAPKIVGEAMLRDIDPNLFITNANRN